MSLAYMGLCFVHKSIISSEGEILGKKAGFFVV